VPLQSLTDGEYRALAELRFRLRSFVSFSEEQARMVGLEPRQHQLLLAVRGLPANLRPTIGTLAERLVVKHHTLTELLDRLEAVGLAQRQPDPEDKRVVLVSITPRGRAMLDRLSLAHRAELAKTAPALLEALKTVVGAL
jgi:DNA-binding MarR family transcriptional regulator